MNDNLFEFESSLVRKGFKRISGVDEVGVGTLSGPLVSAAVILNPEKVSSLLALSRPSIKDSKLLSPKSREKLYPLIIDGCLDFAFGYVYPAEINEIRNIQKCGYLARFRAVSKIDTDYILSDHFDVPETDIPSLGITKGDNKSLSIASASILAKVTRDRYMTELSKKFPKYNWDKNLGYCTPDHVEAIRKYGVTEHHKVYYNPIPQILAERNG